MYLAFHLNLETSPSVRGATNMRQRLHFMGAPLVLLSPIHPSYVF